VPGNLATLHQAEFADTFLYLQDPVNTTTTLGFHHDEVEFADEVRDHVKRHASKSREQWKAEMIGESGEDVDEQDEDTEGADVDDDDEMDDESSEDE